MLWQSCQGVDEAYTVGARLSHADNAAAADVDARTADFGQRVEPVVHGPRGNDLIIALGRGIDIMVVIIQASVGEHVRLTWGQHTQGHAGFHTHRPHALNDLHNCRHVAILGVPPCSPHTEAA